MASPSDEPLAQAGIRVIFPSTEKKYGRSIAEWQQIIAAYGREKHMAIVGYLKSEHGMGHGHANALGGWTLAGNVAHPWCAPMTATGPGGGDSSVPATVRFRNPLRVHL